MVQRLHFIFVCENKVESGSPGETYFHKQTGSPGETYFHKQTINKRTSYDTQSHNSVSYCLEGVLPPPSLAPVYEEPTSPSNGLNTCHTTRA
jgi:hypothetical protein